MEKAAVTQGEPMALADCSGYQVRMLARLITKHFEKDLGPSGLSLSQVGLLSTLCRQNGASVSHLAEVLGMDRTTMTRNLQNLVRQGLIRMEPGADKRTRTVRLTPDGQSRINAARPLVQASQQRLAEHLGKHTVSALNAMMADAMEKLIIANS